MRLGLRDGALGPRHFGLIRPGINLEERLALFDFLAVREKHLGEIA